LPFTHNTGTAYDRQTDIQTRRTTAKTALTHSVAHVKTQCTSRLHSGFSILSGPKKGVVVKTNGGVGVGAVCQDSEGAPTLSQLRQGGESRPPEVFPIILVTPDGLSCAENIM